MYPFEEISVTCKTWATGADGPVTLTRNSRGICRCEHNWIKCVAFRADGENRMPLLATMPTWYPCICAKPWIK